MGQEAESKRVQGRRQVRRMRPTISWLLAGMLVLGLVGSYTASAHLDDQMREGQLEEPETLTLRLAPPQDTKFIDVDLGKKGPSRGDLVYIRYALFDEGGEKVGHTLAICEQFTRRPRVLLPGGGPHPGTRDDPVRRLPEPPRPTHNRVPDRRRDRGTQERPRPDDSRLRSRDRHVRVAPIGIGPRTGPEYREGRSALPVACGAPPSQWPQALVCAPRGAGMAQSTMISRSRG